MANQTSAYGIATSNIISTFDLGKPEVRNKLFRSKGDQGMGAFRILESLGYTRGISQDIAYSYEEDWIHPTFHSNGIVGATAAGATTALITQDIVLDPTSPNDDFLDFVKPQGGGNYYYCPVQMWDIIMYPNNVTAQVTNIAGEGTSSVTVTVTAQDGSTGLPALTAGEELIIISNAFPEGSEQPTGFVNKPKKSSSYAQIIKAGYKWTGTQATNQSWFTEYKSADDIPAYYLKGQMDTDYELMLKIDGALLFSNQTLPNIVDTTSFAASGFEPVKTTQGMVPYIRQNGNVKQYTPGTFTIQTFNDIIKILDKQFTPKYICGMLGIDLDLEVEDVLKQYFQNTNISYLTDNMVADVFNGDKGLAMSVGFNVLGKGNYTFGLTKMPIFSHARLYGAAGYKTPALGMFIPMAKKKDLKSDYEVPYFGVIYKELGGYSRKAEVWTLQGAAPGTKTLSKDINQLCMRSHIGAEHVGGNQCLLLDPQ